jgi:hypothetical protein
VNKLLKIKDLLFAGISVRHSKDAWMVDRIKLIFDESLLNPAEYSFDTLAKMLRVEDNEAKCSLAIILGELAANDMITLRFHYEQDGVVYRVASLFHLPENTAAENVSPVYHFPSAEVQIQEELEEPSFIRRIIKKLFP